MKKIMLFFLLVFASGLSWGQTLKLQAGLSVSNSPYKFDGFNEALLEDYGMGYSVFLGIDYMENKYYNLSSNIGFIQKGGKSDPLPEEYQGIDCHTPQRLEINYVSVNTLFEFKYPVNKVIPFVSAGPRLDIYAGGGNGLINKDLVGGLLLGGGVKYDLPEAVIGIRADYYLNFTVTGEWNKGEYDYNKIEDNTYIINILFGYKL